MAAIARIDLRLTEREFWEMTPRQFQALVKRHELAKEERWQHTASMMALYANCHRDDKKHPQPFGVDDFMPRREQVAQEQQTPEDQMLVVGALAEAMGQPLVYGTQSDCGGGASGTECPDGAAVLGDGTG